MDDKVKGDRPYRYDVNRRRSGLPLQLDWSGEFWNDCDPLQLRHHMGQRPVHFPTVQAKLAYDDESLDVCFRVEDRFVIARATAHQQMVCRDSCVEFFFAPAPDVHHGYFNLEINCSGRMLFHFQPKPRQDSQPLPADVLNRIDIVHTMPAQITDEIVTPTVWSVAYRLPLIAIAEHFPGPFQQPEPGVTWRANLFKCADESSHPHWLTWSPIDHPRPDFHRPDQFGHLRFE